MAALVPPLLSPASAAGCSPPAGDPEFAFRFAGTWVQVKSTDLAVLLDARPPDLRLLAEQGLDRDSLLNALSQRSGTAAGGVIWGKAESFASAYCNQFTYEMSSELPASWPARGTVITGRGRDFSWAGIVTNAIRVCPPENEAFEVTAGCNTVEMILRIIREPLVASSVLTGLDGAPSQFSLVDAKTGAVLAGIRRIAPDESRDMILFRDDGPAASRFRFIRRDFRSGQSVIHDITWSPIDASSFALPQRPAEIPVAFKNIPTLVNAGFIDSTDESQWTAGIAVLKERPNTASPFLRPSLAAFAVVIAVYIVFAHYRKRTQLKEALQ